MEKAAAIAFSTLLLVSLGSAAVIPEDITVDLNINLFGGGEEKENSSEEKENRTYGERVGGQAVHTETGDNDPEVERNTEEYGITEKDTNEQNDFAESVSAFFHNLFGTGNAPDTSEPNSVT